VQQPSTASVLAILVVHNGAAWIRRSVAALARQTHGRVGMLAVDNASIDGSAEILEGLLGKRRVLRAGVNVGFPGAVRRAMQIPAARQADYVLLVHDDVALAPDAIARLVAAARRFEGTGIVGPKVLDWDRPGVLREVGFAADRFGVPFSPLEEDEIDQGQYDSPREVLFVSSTAMLVSRDAYVRTDGPDERLGPAHGDLDFGWRVRLAGYRVLVAPDAVAYHRASGAAGEREGTDEGRERFHVDRSSLAALLKSYRALTLLWLLPVFLVRGVFRVVVATFTRRLDDAGQALHAWGWNLLRFPGTLRRRVRGQATRRVRDHEIARFMTPAGSRIRSLAQRASALVASRTGALEPEEEDLEHPPLRRRAAAFVGEHPVASALALAGFLILVGFRDVLYAPEIEGGALPSFPARAADFFGEFASPWRSTGFGGAGGASPALVALGIAGTLTLGSTSLLARLIVALGPFAAGATCARAVLRLTSDARAAVVAGLCYALSALSLWSASNGRVAGLVLLVGMPWLAVRVGGAFDVVPHLPFRWTVGTAVVLAVVGSFFPAVWVAVALVALTAFVSAGRRATGGVGLVLAALLAAGVLAWPLALQLVAAGGGTAVEAAGRADFALLLRLAPGDAPGTWLPALFLPLAGVVAYPLAAERDARWAGRALAIATLGIPLAWLAAAGYLPGIISNPLAFLAPAAFALSLLVGLAVSSMLAGVRRTAFGVRQLAAVALGLVVGAGLVAQGGRVLLGGWEVRENGTPPAWPVVARANAGTPFRVLWVGPPDGDPFPAPGGQPEAAVDAGEASVVYGVTSRAGRSALAIGLPASGEAYAELHEALSSILSGEVRHGGAVLSPFGIRFVVAGETDLTDGAERRLDDQVDLELIQRAGGLSIWRNAAALPLAYSTSSQQALDAARSTDPLAAASLDPENATPLEEIGGPRWVGSLADGAPVLVALSTEHDAGWRASTPAGEGSAFPALGWATAFEAPTGGTEVTVAFDAGVERPLRLAAFAALWIAALWVLRRAPQRGRRRAADARRSAVARAPGRPPAPRPQGTRT
jgi:GT2 family glycosyltransferase